MAGHYDGITYIDSKVGEVSHATDMFSLVHIIKVLLIRALTCPLWGQPIFLSQTENFIVVMSQYLDLFGVKTTFVGIRKVLSVELCCLTLALTCKMSLNQEVLL